MFDARQSQGTKRNQAMVSIATVAMMAVAFCTVLFWPEAKPQPEAGPQLFQAKLAKAETNLIGLAMPGIDTDRLDRALLSLDPDGHATLTKALKASQSEEEAVRLLNAHILLMVSDHSGALSGSDVRHFDNMLNATQSGLRQASRSGNKWCRGERYVALETADDPEQAAKDFAERFILENPKAAQYAADLVAMLIEAAVDGRANKRRYGKLTPQDNAALQGVMFSLFSDPQIMPLMIAGQTGGNMSAEVVRLDVCAVGVSVITAVRTLPQDTKGRFWADLTKGGRNLGGISLQ